MTGARKRRTEREAPDMGAFMRRVSRAMVRRAGEGDLEAVAELVRTKRELDRCIAEAARAAHGFGYSWTEIARELGVSRQAARQQYGQTTTGEQG